MAATSNGGAPESFEQAPLRTGLVEPGDPGDGLAAHDVPRISGLVEDAVHRGAEHLNDPEAMRRTAVDVGRRLHSVERRHLFDGALVDRLFDRLGEIREGAELRPALAHGDELMTVVDAAETTMKLEVAGGQAAGQAAERLVEELVRLERDLAEARLTERGTEVDVETQEEAFEAALDAYQDQHMAAGDVETVHGRGDAGDAAARRRSVFEVIRISPKAFVIAVLAELVATTFLLSGPISELVSVSYSWEPYLIATAISAALTGLGAVAGFAAAAARLPARVAGVLIVALAVFMLLSADSLLTLLRLGDERGVELLSLATMATIVIAAVTIYSATLYEAHERAAARQPEERDVLDRLDVPFAIPHPLNVPARRLARAKRSLAEARAETERRAELLAAKSVELAGLWTVVDETPVRVLAAEKAGIEARVAFEGLQKRTTIVLRQERANVEACKAAAELGHRLVRAEERPDTELWTLAAREDADVTRWPPAPLIAALAIVAAGAILAVLVPSVWIAAIALVMAAAAWRFAERRRGAHAIRSRRDDRTPPIHPLADREDPTWHELPSFSVPKWRRGDTAPTERH